MTLFALMRDSETPILRFHLTAELLAQVSEAFVAQFATFNHGVIDSIPFDGRAVPEADELLVIENLADPYGLAAAIAAPLTVDALDPARIPLDHVKAVFFGLSHEGRNLILFQVFEKKRVIASTGSGVAMFFSGDTFKPVSGAGLALDHRLSAVLDGATLTFKSFFYARQLFDLRAYLREATDDQVETFSQHAKLAVADLDQFKANASAPIRMRIAVILDSRMLDLYSNDQIAQYAQGYNIAVAFDDEGKIVIPSDKKQLKALLDLLDEGFYTSALSQKRYQSRGKRLLP